MYFSNNKKMLVNHRITVVIIMFVFTAAIWIYRSTNAEVNDTISKIRNNNYFITDFILKPSNETCKNKPFIIVLVTSYVGHVELRSAHRRAISTSLLKSMNIVRIFLLAKIPNTEKYITQESIKDESSSFNDILQGSFIENYRNLTHKHLMGLNWAASSCNEASFILKVDDDTVFNYNKTNKYISEFKSIDRNNFLIGYVLENTKPKRQMQNKWYVTWDEYSRNKYPPYLSGWYYITTPEVAARIVNEATYNSYFWIDDIFVTGIITESLNIKLERVPKNFWLQYYELLECCMRDMIKKFIKCDYVVSPNGGRNNLIVEFNEAVQNCEDWRNCTLRDPYKPLDKVCVAFGQRDIFSEGQVEIHSVNL